MSNPFADLLKGIMDWYGIVRRDQRRLQDRLKRATDENRRLNSENQRLFEENERLQQENADLKKRLV